MKTKEKHYLVKEGTKLHTSIDKLFHWHLAWVKEPFHSELVELLGVDPTGNIVLSNDFLGLAEVPEHLEKQFRVRISPGDGFVFRKARSNSNINKAYIELCKKHNVSKFDSWDFKISNNIPVNHNGNTFSKIGEQEFVIVTTYDYSDRDDLYPMKFTEYLELRAKYISSLEELDNE